MLAYAMATPALMAMSVTPADETHMREVVGFTARSLETAYPSPFGALIVNTITGERLRREQEGVRGQGGSKLLRRVLAPAMNVATANIKERMLVAGNLLSWGFHGIAFAIALSHPPSAMAIGQHPPTP